MIPKQLQKNEYRFVLLKPKEKIPFEKAWQENGYTFNNPKLIQHIKNGGNYGVIGGYGNLRILDIDDKKRVEEYKEKFKDTFMVQTGSGGLHIYLLTDYNMNHILKNNLGEFRANNYQVVGAGCTHPNGNTYKELNNQLIKRISEKELLEILKENIRDGIPITNIEDTKDETRSAIEYRKVLSLIKQGKTKEDIFKEMMLYSKWATAHQKYRELTYEKAKKFVELNPSKNTASIIKSFYDKKDLAKKIWKAKPYFFDETQIWWLWDEEEFKWKRVDNKDILNIVGGNSNANTINSKEKTEIIEAMSQYGRLVTPKPIKKTWIQFKDTIVDYETGEEFKATPEYFVTNPIPYQLHKERYVETPIMDKLFTEWVGEEYKEILYEIIAYCLIPDYPIHRLFCFIGEGLNGKSCFLRLLKKFIGEDNVTSTELDTLLTSRFEITKLHKKLVCIMGETNFSEISKTSVLKKLTGQDTIGFEYKGKTPFDDINYAKILIATNNLPSTTDKTTGFYRRWAIIDFPNKFSEDKEILEDIPEEEYEILAVKSLFVLKDLMTKRKFHKEGTIEERAKRYEDHSDPLEKFLKEYTEEDFEGYIWKFEFEKTFNEWCKDNRFRQMSDVSIGKKMKEKAIEQGQKRPDWLVDGQQKSVRAWLGIKWKEDFKGK